MGRIRSSTVATELLDSGRRTGSLPAVNCAVQHVADDVAGASVVSVLTAPRLRPVGTFRPTHDTTVCVTPTGSLRERVSNGRSTVGPKPRRRRARAATRQARTQVDSPPSRAAQTFVAFCLYVCHDRRRGVSCKARSKAARRRRGSSQCRGTRAARDAQPGRPPSRRAHGLAYFDEAEISTRGPLQRRRRSRRHGA